LFIPCKSKKAKLICLILCLDNFGGLLTNNDQMKQIYFVIILTALSSCSILNQPVEVEVTPMPIEEFMQKPFGHNESIDDFKAGLPDGTRVQKLIKRNPRPHHKPDTVYNFLFKKSKISVYKTQFNQEFLLGGNVRNPQIVLVNGIRKGMAKAQFFNCFTDFDPSPNDTISIKEPKFGRTFNFYFNKKGMLERFSFTGKT